MPITRIRGTNFKSFRSLDLELNALNVIVGANAAGKTNLVDLIRFIRDVAWQGLETALATQGGGHLIRNVAESHDTPIGFGIEYRVADDRTRAGTLEFHLSDDRSINLRTNRLIYDFALTFNKSGSRFKTERDRVSVEYELFAYSRNNPGADHVSVGAIQLDVENNQGRLTASVGGTGASLVGRDQLFPELFEGVRLPDDTVLLDSSVVAAVFPFSKVLSAISIFDIDPRVPRFGLPRSSETELDENAENLATVVYYLLQDKETRRSLLNLVREVLPFVQDTSVEVGPDRSMLLQVKETYTPRTSLPASMLADGTLNVMALIIGLYFSRNPVAIFEEPERGVHPSLASKIGGMLYDASRHKQIVVTTHSAELVKHLSVDDLILIAREGDGASRAARPVESQQVRTFLSNELGLDDLLVANMLSP